ncbi:hypothetical protein AOQ84DRAFT_347687 [Glonium stellatum]|uniref:Alpha/beta hydrolase fold-3 domain-containing protein n=1 Tax=Glonium stellatum TaxID=574774 RepID=A0A8E2ERI4_9PEZI|nr:hypothetical protein AOQ84DRAFT_347687 [Glonium stellatum]
MPLQYDPELFVAIQPLLPLIASAPKPPVGDTATRREIVRAQFGTAGNQVSSPKDVEISIHHIKANDSHEFPIYHFQKKNFIPSANPGPAILHYHGGGLISLSVEDLKKFIATQASLSGVQIFSVEYSLAPDAPFPVPVDECYAGLLWVQEHAKEYNIDPARIAVMGESAGGGLAAAVALLARDRQLSPPLAKQILIYPMLDDRNLKPNPEIEPFATWNNADNITAWTAYLGDKAGKDGVSPYAAPGRAESVEGLPPTYIDVGGLDLFRDEGCQYASRLAAANIATEFHLFPGVPHGFEMMAPHSSVTLKVGDSRLRAMLSF